MKDYGLDVEISLEPRDKVNLDYTSGMVIPYKDYNLPSEFFEPIRTNINGKYSGFVSGGRAALIKSNSKWFKYKGISPKPIPFPWFNEIKKL